jgi:hypothetical protein
MPRIYKTLVCWLGWRCVNRVVAPSLFSRYLVHGVQLLSDLHRALAVVIVLRQMQSEGRRDNDSQDEELMTRLLSSGYLSVVACSLLLTALFETGACGADIMPPAPPPVPSPTVHKESDDWVKPGTKVKLKGGIAPGRQANTFRVVNNDTFAWTLLDDIWLGVRSPNGQFSREGSVFGDDSYMYLRCPAPRTIPPGADIEMSFDACRATTAEPGPDAVLNSFYIVAKEGYSQVHIDFGGRIRRQQNHASQAR